MLALVALCVFAGAQAWKPQSDDCGCRDNLAGKVHIPKIEKSPLIGNHQPLGHSKWHTNIDTFESTMYYRCLLSCHHKQSIYPADVNSFVAASKQVAYEAQQSQCSALNIQVSAIPQKYFLKGNNQGNNQAIMYKRPKTSAHRRRGSFGVDASFSTKNGFCIDVTGTSFTAGFVSGVLDYLKSKFGIHSCNSGGNNCGNIFETLGKNLLSSSDKKTTLRNFVTQLLHCYKDTIVGFLTSVIMDNLDIAKKLTDVVEGGIELAWDCGTLAWDYFWDDANSFTLGHDVADCAIDILKEAYNVITTVAMAGRRRAISAVPANWTCHELLYNDTIKCQLDCGAVDPDCYNGDLPMVEFKNEYDVPNSWVCPPVYFNSSDGCDLNCGAEDPDCALGEEQDADAGVGEQYFWFPQIFFSYHAEKLKETHAQNMSVLINPQFVSKMAADSSSQYYGSYQGLPEGNTGTSNGRSSVGTIVGICVGAVCAVALMAVFVMRQRGKVNERLGQGLLDGEEEEA